MEDSAPKGGTFSKGTLRHKLQEKLWQSLQDSVKLWKRATELLNKNEKGSPIVDEPYSLFTQAIEKLQKVKKAHFNFNCLLGTR